MPGKGEEESVEVQDGGEERSVHRNWLVELGWWKILTGYLAAVVLTSAGDDQFEAWEIESLGNPPCEHEERNPCDHENPEASFDSTS
jgi:hypothetical protein